ncbi:PhaM family polyhydroxyalkanoate granule multifunctional regulatory protein [Hydrogenophaga sp.]|uniref:PhaM family polyhydroxyalkanoate granule multifunctional regulatory protein n=1 Tax=Hydrogenophaga sp. TaxID=1904254 RepID=UPI00286E3953|nr:PhaM family polyhydroxyalkanoate granule multifunctional regulatory protein [Hydrogenophaga sp.]
MSDDSGSGFGKYVPGFEFLQNLASQAAGGVAQGLGSSLPQMPNLGHWVAPTFNVEELDKRIEELKAVHFWLDQNTKALAATIQALEVQKMTLATLKTMNFSLGDVANALKIKAADAVAGFTAAAAPAPTQFAGLEIPPRTYGNPAAQAPQEEEPEADDEPPPEPAPRQAAARKKAPAPEPAAGGVVDPMQWWGALSQQFQTIAANAMKDVAKQTALDTTRHVASGLTEQAVKTATGMAGKAADTVARNVGAAVGMGQAAARAVARKPATKAAAKAAKAPAAPKKKAAPARKAAARPPAPAQAAARTASAPQPLATGDWPLPTAFFPGFQSVTGNAPASPAAAKKAAAKKAPASRARRR